MPPASRNPWSASPGLALAVGVVAALLTAALDVRLLASLAAVWIWLGLMNAEFFAPQWLKARPFVYLVERFFQIQQFRGVAARYEKTARNFLAGLQLVCAFAWLK